MEPRPVFIQLRPGETLTPVIPSKPCTLVLPNPDIRAAIQTTNSSSTDTGCFSCHQPKEVGHIGNSVISSDDPVGFSLQTISCDQTLPGICTITSVCPEFSPSSSVPLHFTQSGISINLPVQNTIKTSYVMIKESSDKFYNSDTKKLDLNSIAQPKLLAYVVNNNIKWLGHNEKINTKSFPLRVASNNRILNPENIPTMRVGNINNKRREVLHSSLCQSPKKSKICPVNITTDIQQPNLNTTYAHSLMRSNENMERKEVSSATCQSSNTQKNVRHIYRKNYFDFTSNANGNKVIVKNLSKISHSPGKIPNNVVSQCVDKPGVQQNAQRLNLDTKYVYSYNSIPSKNKKDAEVSDMNVNKDIMVNDHADKCFETGTERPGRQNNLSLITADSESQDLMYCELIDMISEYDKSGSENLDFFAEKSENVTTEFSSPKYAENIPKLDIINTDIQLFGKQNENGKVREMLEQNQENNTIDLNKKNPNVCVGEFEKAVVGSIGAGELRVEKPVCSNFVVGTSNTNTQPNVFPLVSSTQAMTGINYEPNSEVTAISSCKSNSQNVVYFNGSNSERDEETMHNVDTIRNEISKEDDDVIVITDDGDVDNGSDIDQINNSETDEETVRNVDTIRNEISKEDDVIVITDNGDGDVDNGNYININQINNSETDEETVHNVDTVRNEISKEDDDVIVITDNGDGDNDNNICIDPIRKNRNTEVTDNLIIIDSDDDCANLNKDREIVLIGAEKEIAKSSTKIHVDVNSSNIGEVKGIQKTVSEKTLREHVVESKNQRGSEIKINESTVQICDRNQEIIEVSEDTIHFEEDEQLNTFPIKELISPIKCEKKRNSVTHEQQFFIKDLVKTIKIEPPDSYNDVQDNILAQQLPEPEELSSVKHGVQNNNVEENGLYRLDMDESSVELVINEDNNAAVEIDSYELIDDIVSKNKNLFKRNRECRTRLKTFNLRTQLKRYKLKGSDEFRCRTCKKTFKLGVNFLKHVLIHRNGKMFSCDECSRHFIDKTELVLHHDRNHRKDVYTCDRCFSHFSSRYNFFTHYTFHTGEVGYYCDGCGDTFRTNSELIEHRLKTNELPFICEKCDRKFPWKSLLHVHQKIHSNKAYVCGGCSQSFKYSVLLFIHQFSVADGLPCRYQNMEFRTKFMQDEEIVASRLESQKRLKSLAESKCNKRSLYKNGGMSNKVSTDQTVESNKSQVIWVKGRALVEEEVVSINNKDKVSPLEKESAIRKQREETELHFSKFQLSCEPNFYICPICFEITYGLKYHMENKHNTGDCLYCFFTNHSLFSHIVHMNQNHNKLKCRKCDLITEGIETHYNHMLFFHFKDILTSGDKVYIVKYSFESGEISTELFYDKNTINDDVHCINNDAVIIDDTM